MIILFVIGIPLKRFFLLQHMLIASNAAIGGPATAAVFAGNSCRLGPEYVIAATFWGVFGYAIGTPIGVRIFRFLINRNF